MRATHACLDFLHLGANHDVRFGFAVDLVMWRSRVDYLRRETQDGTDGHRQAESDLVERQEPHWLRRKNGSVGES